MSGEEKQQQEWKTIWEQWVKKDESACASYLWKVLSPCLFSIKDIALVLSQEDDTFSMALHHLIAISLMLFLCKCIFPSSSFLCPNETSAMLAALPSLATCGTIIRYTSQHFWALSSHPWYCRGDELDAFRVKRLWWYMEKRWCSFPIWRLINI